MMRSLNASSSSFSSASSGQTGSRELASCLQDVIRPGAHVRHQPYPAGLCQLGSAEGRCIPFVEFALFVRQPDGPEKEMPMDSDRRH